MSYTPEAIVVSGYRLPREIFNLGMELCEEHWEIFEKDISGWEDFFIDMDLACCNGDTFFGSIIYTVPEDGRTKEFDTITADYNTIKTVQEKFHAIFDHIYKVKGWPMPSYNKYLGIRWA